VQLLRFVAPRTNITSSIHPPVDTCASAALPSRPGAPLLRSGWRGYFDCSEGLSNEVAVPRAFGYYPGITGFKDYSLPFNLEFGTAGERETDGFVIPLRRGN
jgi:hypothetical protein